MEYALIFGLFALVLLIVVLRFGAIISSMVQQQAVDRGELVREIDASHAQAFTNAMAALSDVQTRVIESQTAMFNRTMDMVHGPQPVANVGEDYAVDDPALDMRPAWMPDDEFDYLGSSSTDPTDDMLPDPPLAPQDNGRAVSIRPGETLIPHG